MSVAPDPYTPTVANNTLLEELAREVLALRAELADLRQQLATEVRTRRLVVVGENGFESIVASVTDDTADVLVRCQGELGTHATLHANDHHPGSSFAGVYLSGGGNIVGNFDVHQAGDDGAGNFPGDIDPDSATYSASLDVIEDRGRVVLSVDGLKIHQ